jgi:hypothetical protein
MQKLFSMLVASGLVAATALPALACGGGGGCATSGGGYGYGGRAVAYGKVGGRAPMLAQTTPATIRGPAAPAPTAVVSKTGATPAVHTLAAKVTRAQKAPASGPVYTCPMHPQVQWTKPTDCPICGMKLKLKPAKADATRRAPAASDEHAGMNMDEMSDMPGMEQEAMGGMDDVQMCPGCKMNMGGMSGMNGKHVPTASQKASRGSMGAVAGIGCGC